MFKADSLGLGKNPAATYHLREFDTLDEYLKFARDGRDPEGTSSRKENNSWFYTHGTFDEAWDHAYNGWETVRPRVDQVVNAVRERIQDLVTPVPVRVHDMIGFEPDIDRYVAGEIECMWDEMVVETPHAGKVFTILLDTCITAMADKDEMLKRGAAVIALIESFQMFGFELEIWCETTVGNWSSGPEEFHSTLVRIAKAGDRPDINAIMFPLANPDWQRRLSFASQEWESDVIRRKFGFNSGGGYGKALNGCHFGKRVEASIELSLEAADRRMVSDPTQWIIDQLVAQGVIEDDG
jgi:hypothetical protein